MVIYMLGSASVLVAVPASALAERSGIAEAVELVAARVGLAGLGGLTGLLLALGGIAGTSSWTAGAARVPFAAGADRVLPRAFGKLHTRYRTPHVALVIQGLVASAIFLVSVFLTIAGGETTVQEAYDILVNLTILIYFIPYIYLFLSAVRLRASTDGVDGPDVIRVPGGTVGLWTVAMTGTLATTVSLLLLFVPPSGTENVLNYEANLVLQATGILVIGAGLYRHSQRSDSRAETPEL
jgi:amino acid transporter